MGEVCSHETVQADRLSSTTIFFLNNFVFEKSLQSIFDAVDWSCGGVDARSF